MLDTALTLQLLVLAKQAGLVILDYYHKELDIELKQDKSPVTIADKAANDVIVEGLKRLVPTIPVVSEENDEAENQSALIAPSFWLVDPLDGTKSFIKGTDEFTVNIALIEEGQPTIGVIYVPAQDVFYYATGKNGEAFKKVGNDQPVRIEVNHASKEDALIAVASASHTTPETEAFIQQINVKERISVSSSIKLCWVAEGAADVYPRFGRTMEWDIAAGHAVLNAAGGHIVRVDGGAFTYGKAALDNPYFVAWGRGRV